MTEKQNKQPRTHLSITYPNDGSATSQDPLEVEIQIKQGWRNSKPVSAVALLRGKSGSIMLDGEVAATISHMKRQKFSYPIKVKLEDLSEGTHTLHVVLHKERHATESVHGTPKIDQRFPHFWWRCLITRLLKTVLLCLSIRFRTRAEQEIHDSEPVSFVIDRTPPVITNVFPSDSIIIRDRDLSVVLVECKDSISGLDVAHCTVTIDEYPLTNPRTQRHGIVFPVTHELGEGTHAIAVTVYDRAGNTATYQSEFQVVPISAEEEEAEKRYQEEHLKILEDKLENDPTYQKTLLTDPHTALSDMDISYSRLVASIFPPPLPEEHADFLLNVDPDEAEQVLEPLLQRVRESLENGDNERVVRKFEQLGANGPLTADGFLTNGAKETISTILQNPERLLADLGITPTDQEREFLPPAFPQKTADALTQWISTMIAGQVEAISPERRDAMLAAGKRITGDIEAQVKWLSDPAGAFKEAYPDATRWDLATLPDPIPEEEARQMLTPALETNSSPPAPTSHNSTDVVIGIGIDFLKMVLDGATKNTFPYVGVGSIPLTGS